MSEEHILPVRTYLIVFAALLALLGATVGIAYVDLNHHFGVSSLNIGVAMIIAIIKAMLVLLYFMHVRYSNKLVWVVSIASFLWLGILLVIGVSDYLARNWLGDFIPGK